MNEPEPKPENVLRADSSYSKEFKDTIRALLAVKDWLYIAFDNGTVKKYLVGTKWEPSLGDWKVSWSDPKDSFKIKETGTYINKMIADETSQLLFMTDNRQKKIYIVGLNDLQLRDGFCDAKNVHKEFNGGKMDFGQKIINFCLDSGPDKHRVALQLSQKDKPILIYTYAHYSGEHIYKMYQDPDFSIDGLNMETSHMFLCGDLLTYNLVDQSEMTIYSIQKKKERISTKNKGTAVWPEIKTKTPHMFFLKKSPKENNKYVCVLKSGNRADVVHLDGIDTGNAVTQYADNTHDTKKFGDCLFSADTFDDQGNGMAHCFPYIGGIIKDQNSGNTSIEFRNLFNSRDEKKRNFCTSCSDPPSISQYKDLLFLTGSRDRFYAASLTKVYPIIPPTYLNLRSLLTQDSLSDHANTLKEMKGKSEDILGLRVDQGRGFLINGKFSSAIGAYIGARNEYKKKGDGRFNVDIDARPLIAKFITFSESSGFEGVSLPVNELNDNIRDYMLVPQIILKGENPTPELLKALNNSVPLFSELSVPTQDSSHRAILLYKAETSLITYLEKIRNPDDRELDEQRAIDFTLLQLYLQRMRGDLVMHEKIVKLLKGKNSCCTDNNEIGQKFISLLKDNKRFLALLYVSKSQYVDALNVLSAILKSVDKKGDDTEGEVIHEIVDILSKVSDWETVISKYGKMVMDIDATKSVAIFTTKREEVTFRPKIIKDFLSTYPSDVLQTYLQYLIENEKNTQETFHTMYAEYLIKNLTTLIPQNTDLGNHVRIQAGKEPGLVGVYRTALLRHLETTHYDKMRVQELLLDTSLYVEQSILYKITGKPEKGIEVLLVKLRDYKLAEQYCDELFTPTHSGDDPSPSFSFNPLFVLYVKICFAKYYSKERDQVLLDQTLVAWGLNLLRYRAKEIDPFEIVKCIDKDTEISKLEQFLKESMMQVHEKYTSSKLLLKISESANLDTHNRRQIVSQRNVDITLQSVCSECKQPIGDSVVSVFPDLSIVHYRCLRLLKDGKTRDRFIHPATGQDFKKYPAVIDFSKRMDD